MLAKNHHECIERIIAELVAWENGQRPRSWNVVAPPGFGAARLADDLFRSICNRCPNCKIAVVAADGVSCSDDFYVQIAHDWGVPGVPAEGRRATPRIKIGDLLGVAPEVPHVILIREFHKILTALDEPILSALRDEEHAGHICTVAFSIYPHDWIKREWRQSGGYFGASNYGDTHAALRLMPRDTLPDDLEDFPRAAIEAIATQTGMYPEAFDCVLQDWRDRGCRPLTFEERHNIGAAAEEALAPLCKRIDYGRSRMYSNIVRRLHMQVASDEDFLSLERAHPWSRILLEGGNLRAQALGSALATLEIKEAIESGRLPEERTKMLALVERNYTAGNYGTAERIAKQIGAIMPSTALSLVICHAEIMRALIGGANDCEVPSLESNWRAVVGSLRRAPESIGAFADDQSMSVELLGRYEELEKFGQRVLQVRKGMGNGRLIDTLGGLYGDQAIDEILAYRLVTLQLESSRTLRGNGAAVKSIVELPEQMMRLWGFWKHGVNYYKAPQLSETVANSAAVYMGMPPEEVSWPQVGAKFRSLKSFSCYCYALEVTSGCGSTWCTGQEFLDEIAFLDNRNLMSHATTFIDAEDRRKFFAICDRWHDRIGKQFEPSGCAGRAAILRMFAPLPIPRLT